MSYQPGNIYLLTGPIRTGKTTRLATWLEGRDAAGILTPDREGIRWMKRLSDGIWIPFEVKAETDLPIIDIGRFRFFAEAFTQAKTEFQQAVERQAPWIVVDEVGKLEVKGKGLEPAITRLTEAHQSGDYTGNLLLVVREELLEKVLEKWKITEWREWTTDS